MIITKLFLLIWALLLQPQNPPDDQLIVEHADKHMGKKIAGEQLRILEGNVHIRQDTLNMYCDRAVFYENREKLEFTGNVLLDNGTRTLRARRIIYYPDRKWADCFDRVIIRGKTDSLYSNRFSYDFDSEFAKASDSLYIVDFLNQVEIWGDYGTYFAKKNRSVVKTNARLVQTDSSSQDSFIVTANRLTYIGDSLAKAIAQDSVTIFQGELKAICDSAVYFPDLETAELYIEPYVWFENNELGGDYIAALFDSLEVKSIKVTGNAEAKSIADSVTNKTNILKGKEIDFSIEDRKPQLIVAKINAVSIYHLQEDSVDQGSNFATSDTIIIFFKEGQLDSIDIIGGAEGVFYPENYKGEKAFE